VQSKRATILCFLLTLGLGLSCGSRLKDRGERPSARNDYTLDLPVGSSTRFVVLGDTRFHDPSDTTAASPAVRQAMVAAIDKERPAFISIIGDIVYTGADDSDWKVWDSESKAWRDHHVPVYPVLGNHDLKGDRSVALSNYFARFPDVEQNRFYSVRFGNCLLLVLDSAEDELTGEQGEWFARHLDLYANSVDFLFVALHHPPYTSSSDEKQYGGGHTAREREQSLAQMLEARQPHMRARMVVFSGHVHNYEHHEHGGITYFVTGGGGAHPYQIPRQPTDLYQDKGVNYHYLLVEVSAERLEVTMDKLEIADGKEKWSKPDVVTVSAPAAATGSDRSATKP
jgi:Icc-related predicted phosphoesterase